MIHTRNARSKVGKRYFSLPFQFPLL